MAVEPPNASPSSPATQGKRRALYGLNVAIAAGAALALVVVVNVLVDWQYRRMPGALQSLIRYDLTATRAYTLAPQTRKLLGELDEPMRLVAILRSEDRDSADVADLLEEYQRSTDKLEVDLIHPDRELPRLEDFFREIEARYAGETAPLQEAVTDGVAVLRELTADFEALRDGFAELANDEQTPPGDLRGGLRVLANQLEEQLGAYRRGIDQLENQLAAPLPPWGNARTAILNYLQQIDAATLSKFQRDFARRAEERGAPMAVRGELLKLDSRIKRMRQRLRETRDRLTLPPDAPRYDRLSALVQVGEVVVVLTDEAERAVPVSEMFVPGPPDAAGQPTSRFIGEDRLTGTMVTMRRPEPPMVVLVRDTPSSAVGPQGNLRFIASRLATSDFEITEWAVGGGGSGGATIPGAGVPGEASDFAAVPVPRAGQTAVWIVPALSLERTTQDDRIQVANTLQRRLAAGDGVLMCFDYDAEALFREKNPLMELVNDWGVAPRMHEMILRESLGPDGRTRGDAGWTVADWPDGSPLGGALDGRAVKFAGVTPIDLVPRLNTVATPLARLPDTPAWTLDGVTALDDITNSTFTEDAAIDRAVVAAAAYREAEDGNAAVAGLESGRLMVFTERHWLSDALAGQVLGNSELLINCVYWLADLDEAIAATPRTQDVRRIDALSDRRALTYRLLLLAGLPGGMLLAGTGVWLVRRRG
ncbi:MAG: Gldg family protein [Planctomycetota bacterium]